MTLANGRWYTCDVKAPHRRIAAAIAPTVAVVAIGVAPLVAADVTVSLQSDARFYYEGDPIAVRLVAWNPGTESARNPLERSASGGLVLRAADGRELDVRGARDAWSERFSREIAAGASYETTVDLAGVEALTHAGRYELGWSSPRGAARPLPLVVLTRYDDSLHYVAHLQTDLGGIDIRLRDDVSPVAVRAFVDLARAGYYEGSPFSEIQRDSYIVAGDPRYGESPDPSFLFPTEQSTAPIEAGSVVLRPVAHAPPANGPAFYIALRAQPAWDGQVTVVGEVVRGIEVVRRIAQRGRGVAGRAAPGPGTLRIRQVRISSEPPRRDTP